MKTKNAKRRKGTLRNAEELHAKVKSLQASLQKAEQRIGELEKQRDKYYEFTKAWIQQNCRLSDWDDFDPAEYTQDFQKTFAELKAEFGV